MKNYCLLSSCLPRAGSAVRRARHRIASGQHDGTYILGAARQAAPVVFRQHAAQLWQQHRNE